ncbi:hypothetical protein Tco_1123410 [Tanacetum coccineum]|uniref:Uncharacterized protein n=1 Tax=Tanacetum coccineum TaxID=301880 RepID=A0ABQ5J4Y0_9ASTR
MEKSRTTITSQQRLGAHRNSHGKQVPRQPSVKNLTFSSWRNNFKKRLSWDLIPKTFIAPPRDVHDVDYLELLDPFHVVDHPESLDRVHV